MSSEPCEQCGGDGVDGHDCGEDTCCCMYPADNETCDICQGEGGFMTCLGGCDFDGRVPHKRRVEPPAVDAVAKGGDVL